MKQVYKYRLYPTKGQTEILNKTFDLCRQLYNTCLHQRIIAYRQQRKYISKFQQMKELLELKKEFPEYNNIHSQVLQDVIKRVDRAFQNFFKKHSKFPRFKSFDRYHSITYPQEYELKFIGNGRNKRIYISKIGYVKIRWHRDLPKTAQIKLFHITKHGNKYHICICFEVNNEIPKKVIAPNRSVGIDMGLEHFATLSNGTFIEYPKYLKKSENKLKLAQQMLSKKKKGSNNRLRAKKRVFNIHQKIKNQRNDFLHKISRWIANNFDVICVEDLNIKQMMMTNKYTFNKHIADNSWAKFLQYLSYKVETLGGRIVRVDPRRTSQICCNCGATIVKDLFQRQHNCSCCGISIHRDLNSAKLVLRLGTSLLNSEAKLFIAW